MTHAMEALAKCSRCVPAVVVLLLLAAACGRAQVGLREISNGRIISVLNTLRHRHRLMLQPSAQVGCLNTAQCGVDSFCMHPHSSDLRGICQQCWRCCLFPNFFGSCPARCNCNIGSTCEYAYACGQGLFCAIGELYEQPTCQLCTDCTSDTEAAFDGCNTTCASGVWAPSGQDVIDAQVLFLSFFAADLAQEGATISAAELSSWYALEGLDSNQSALLSAAIQPLGPSSITKTDWVAALLGLPSRTLLCPRLPSAGRPAARPATRVPNGCPCNATHNAATFRCSAGSRCSWAAYVGLSTDAILDVTATQMAALCTACDSGQYCPEGTFVENETDVSSLDCPAGFYCRSPASQEPCPSGSFCAARAVEPLSCNYDMLLNTTPYMRVPMPPTNVIQRLRDDRDPMKGNFCPTGTDRPNTVCKAGYYCPNTSTQLRCPRGSFCKAQSVEPRSCSALTHCPAGTSAPRFSYLAFVIAMCVVVALPVVWALLGRVDSLNARSMDLVDKELRRTRTLKATSKLVESFKKPSSQKVGSLGSDFATATPKWTGFHQVEPSILLEFENIALRLRNDPTRMVLQDVSGCFSPGKLNAIMGPSGCGKTTFLDVLCGKVTNGISTGRIIVNGVPGIPLRRLRNVMGFVPQDDIVHEDLTVNLTGVDQCCHDPPMPNRENLLYSAHLKLPAYMDLHKKLHVVKDALTMLALQPIAHCRVGSVEARGISGGQRKRVNIGLELVGMPSILFLDEPTSGLDSTSSSDILTSLSDMAALGMTVITVIHQPRFSNFLLFDQVLLLGKGGRTVYMGPPGIAIPWFQALSFRLPEHENPADSLMDIIAGKLPRWNAATEQVDFSFRSSKLAGWWSRLGHAWVLEFMRMNPVFCHQQATGLDPDIIQAIDEDFDRVDKERHEGDLTGRLDAAEVLELLESLGHKCSLEDVLQLVHKLNNSQTGRGNQEDSTVSKEQLLEAFLHISERSRSNGISVMLRRFDSNRFEAPRLELSEQSSVFDDGSSMGSCKAASRLGQCSETDTVTPTCGGLGTPSQPNTDHNISSGGSASIPSPSKQRLGPLSGQASAPIDLLDEAFAMRRRVQHLELSGGGNFSSNGDLQRLASGWDEAPLHSPQLSNAEMGRPASLHCPHAPSQLLMHLSCSSMGDSSSGRGATLSSGSAVATAASSLISGTATVVRALLPAQMLRSAGSGGSPSTGNGSGNSLMRNMPLSRLRDDVVSTHGSAGAAGAPPAPVARVNSPQAPAPWEVPANTSLALRSVSCQEPATSGQVDPSGTGPTAGQAWWQHPAAGNPKSAGSAPVLGHSRLTGTFPGPVSEGVASDEPMWPPWHGLDASCGTQASPGPMAHPVGQAGGSQPAVEHRSPRTATGSPGDPGMCLQLDTQGGGVWHALEQASGAGPGPVTEGTSDDWWQGGGLQGAREALLCTDAAPQRELTEVAQGRAASSPLLSASPSGEWVAPHPSSRTGHGPRPGTGRRGGSSAATACPPLTAALQDLAKGSAADRDAAREPRDSASVARGRRPSHDDRQAGLGLSAVFDNPLALDFGASSQVPWMEAALKTATGVGSSGGSRRSISDTHSAPATAAAVPPHLLKRPARAHVHLESGASSYDGSLRGTAPGNASVAPSVATAMAPPDSPSTGSGGMLPEVTLWDVSGASTVPSGLATISVPQVSAFAAWTGQMGAGDAGSPTAAAPAAGACDASTKGSGGILRGGAGLDESPSAVEEAGGQPLSALPARLRQGEGSAVLLPSPTADSSTMSRLFSTSDQPVYGSDVALLMSANPLLTTNLSLTLECTGTGTTSLTGRLGSASYPPLSTGDEMQDIGTAGDNRHCLAGALLRSEAWPQVPHLQTDTSHSSGCGLWRMSWMAPLDAAGAAATGAAKELAHNEPVPTIYVSAKSAPCHAATRPPPAVGPPSWPLSPERVKPLHHLAASSGAGDPAPPALQPVQSPPQERRHYTSSGGATQSNSLWDATGTSASPNRRRRASTRDVMGLLSDVWAGVQSSAARRAQASGGGAAVSSAVAALRSASAGGDLLLRRFASSGGVPEGSMPSASGVSAAGSAGGGASSTGMRRITAEVVSDMAVANRGLSGLWTELASRGHSSAVLSGGGRLLASIYNGRTGDAVALAVAHDLLLDELSSRRLPSRFSQMTTLLRRCMIKALRSFWPIRVLDILLLLAASFIIGFIHGTGWDVESVPNNVVMAMVTLGVLATVTHLRTFSQDRVLLWRETHGGVSLLSHFVAQNLMDIIWVVLAPALYLGPYYYLTLPAMRFSSYYSVALGVCWWASGMAYLVAAVAPPSVVLMAGVFVALILGAFVQGLSPSLASVRGGLMEILLGLSYNRWAMEMVSILEFEHYQVNMHNTIIMLMSGIGICQIDTLVVDDGDDALSPAEAISFLQVQSTFSPGYCTRYCNHGHVALWTLGFVFRLLAFAVLKLIISRRGS